MADAPERPAGYRPKRGVVQPRFTPERLSIGTDYGEVSEGSAGGEASFERCLAAQSHRRGVEQGRCPVGHGFAAACSSQKPDAAGLQLCGRPAAGEGRHGEPDRWRRRWGLGAFSY